LHPPRLSRGSSPKIVDSEPENDHTMKRVRHRTVTPRSLLLVVAALLLTLWPGTRAAAAEPTAAERETARSLMDDGDRLRDAGDLWGALERFQTADQIMHLPTTSLELARVQASLLLLVEAHVSALASANSEVGAHEPKAFAPARAAAVELAADLGPRIPDVTVFIEPAVAAGHVQIDGLALPHMLRPLPFKLNPGAHMLVVEAAGYDTHTQQFSLAQAEHAELRIALSALPPSASASITPAPPVSPAPVAAASASTLAAVDAGDPNRAGRTRGYIALAAGGAVLAAGVVTGIVSATKTASIRDRCDGLQCPASVRADVDTANALANITNVAIPLGLLGLGYGVLELLLHRSVEPEGAAHGVSVSFGLGTASIRGDL
jgi:hypothetical protein